MARGVRFLMDGTVQEIDGVDPTMTVLQLLRGRLGRTGTKEGCAEGDCGACTVAVTALEDGRPVTRALNACIVFVPMLDGKELTTVESLGKPGALHPIQQALVDTHASQCGFCTPGFVMSLYAHQASGAGDTTALEDVLAGNLCRCTGYGPILAAARALKTRIADDQSSEETVRRLTDLHSSTSLSLSYECPITGTTKRWISPQSVEELAEVYSQHPGATLIAGATDVGLWVTKQGRTLETVIYLGEIEELKCIEETSDTLSIGAGATYRDAHRILSQSFPDMGEVFRRLGSVQIRNSGTLGGNVANGSPIGDTMPLLIAAGATLHLRKGADTRALPLEDFFLDYGKQDRQPGEFVVRISVPKPAGTATFKAYKISKRFDQDISSVLGAYAMELDGDRIKRIRIAYGGMAATPKRALALEQALTGQPATQSSVEQALPALDQDFSPISDMRASSAYRMAVAKNLLRKALLEATQGIPLRVAPEREAANG